MLRPGIVNTIFLGTAARSLIVGPLFCFVLTITGYGQSIIPFEKLIKRPVTIKPELRGANSFIIWANGRYLMGDTGYLGIKQTDDHNTILVNGRGQEKDGVYEMFKEVPNARLDKIHLAEVDAKAGYFYARGEASAGYYTDLGIRKFDRHFLYLSPGYFVIWDELETDKTSVFTFLMNADQFATVSPVKPVKAFESSFRTGRKTQFVLVGRATAFHRATAA